MRELIFMLFAVSLLAVLLAMTYRTRQAKFATVFFTSLLGLLAFYLFQYGNLAEFTLGAFSAQAKFVKEKREQVQQDAEEVKTVKTQIGELLKESRKSQAEIEEARKQILALKEDLAKTTELASPPVLVLKDKKIEQLKSGFKTTLQFTPSKNQPLGIIVFSVEVAHGGESRIIDFWPSIDGGAFSTGHDSKKISDDGKHASLSYALLSVGQPTVEITLSGKATVEIQGNYLPGVVPVKVE